MKKKIALGLSLLLIFGLFGCGNSSVSSSTVSSNKKTRIVTTIYPVYDWVSNIVSGTNTELTMLQDNGADLHNYQPTADDIAAIKGCDLFIYVGGESDEWVEDVMSDNPGIKTLNLMDKLDTKLEEDEFDYTSKDEHPHEEKEETEYDEHIWLSLKNANSCVKKIEDALSTVDTKNAPKYKDNAEKYCKDLDALDAEYNVALDSIPNKTFVFGDRFPFKYLAKDYNISYYAAFNGCSAETEASFETVAFLSKTIDALGLKNIMVIEGPNHSIAETIIKNTTSKNQKILELDSIQQNNSKSYLDIMKDNLEVLKKAF